MPPPPPPRRKERRRRKVGARCVRKCLRKFSRNLLGSRCLRRLLFDIRKAIVIRTLAILGFERRRQRHVRFLCEYTPPPSSLSYHYRHHGQHHQHHRDYHRKGNPATRSPYSLIASCIILHMRAILRTASPTTSIYFFFVASSCFYNNLIDIVLPQMSYLSPTSRLCRYPACCSLRTNSPPSTSPVVALAFLWCRIPTLTLELRRVMATRKV